MNHFDTAYEQVVQHEGVYSNDPNDTGGETVFGVSRNNFPKWEGWAIVDAHKRNHTTAELRAYLRNNEEILALVKEWYKVNFWNKFGLDDIKDYSLAYEVFDQSVNLGVGRTAGFVQESVNALNYQNRFGSDIAVDQKVGPMTRLRLREVGNDPKYTECLRRALDGLQVGHYIRLANSKSTRSDYRKYIRGWLLNRVGKYNEEGLVA